MPDVPSSASPTTSKPSASSTARADERKLGWSSTISTVGICNRDRRRRGPVAQYGQPHREARRRPGANTCSYYNAIFAKGL